MRKLAAFLLGAALAVTPAAAERLSPEAELARALQGRVAGEPVDCIDLIRVRNSRVIPGTAIIWDTGSVIYVNRPENGADALNRWDTMVTRTPTGRLCSVDTVTMLDSPTRFMTGIVFLGDFIPYRRVRD